MKHSFFKRKPLIKPKLPHNAHLGKETTKELKQAIQDQLRAIVIKRDGGCVMRGRFGHTCSGFRKDGELILQADHLLSRSHSATYADERLVVCVCKGLHGWKSVGNNLRKAEYDRFIRNLLPPDRVDLWERAENEKWKVSKMDWRLELLRLQQLYKSMQNS